MRRWLVWSLSYGIIGVLSLVVLLAGACGDDTDPVAAGGGAGAGGAVGAGGTSLCVPLDCLSLGAECGNAPDGCGGVLTCGACTEPEFCGGGGPNRCGTEPCAAKGCEQECGVLSDGCSGTIQCGCQDSYVCLDGYCEPEGAGGQDSGGAAGTAGSPGLCSKALTARAVSSPIISATRAELTLKQSGKSLEGLQLDAPLSPYPDSKHWLGSYWDWASGGIKHAVVSGSTAKPFEEVGWVKALCVRNSNNYCLDGTQGAPAFTSFAEGLNDVVDLWFTSLYSVGGTEMLAFVHEERVGMSGDAANPAGKTRLGLAWSSNSGNEWRYLGRIASAYGDPQPHNIQGAPYLIKDDYFQVYYVDQDENSNAGIAVVRAKVDQVIAAARGGDVGTGLWKKYRGGAWAEEGLGGLPSFPTPAAKLWGITHTQAAHSSCSNKYYMPLTFMTWGGANASVKLYESQDGLAWSLALILVNEGPGTQGKESGYQYCTVVDTAGGFNGEVGQRFYVYCLKFAEATAGGNNYGLYRWTVELGDVSPNFYRQSTDFDSQQGPAWFYRYGTDAPYSDMTWDPSRNVWQGSTEYGLINRLGAHPDKNENPVLAWVAPNTGTVRVSGTVRDAGLGCGDGAKAEIRHKGMALFSQSWDNGDTVGYSHDLFVTVQKGETLEFVVSKGASSEATIVCDYTIWDPSIEYQ